MKRELLARLRDPAMLREYFRKEIPCLECKGSGIEFGEEDKECRLCSGVGHERIDAH